MARARPEDEATNITIRIPRRLYERLKKIGGATGMSEEVRRRLEASFQIGDGATEDLVTGIAYVTSMLQSHEGDWWKDPFLHQVVVEAITQLLPPKPDKPPPRPRSRRLIDEGMSPESAARMLVVTRPGGQW
jgi:hypothetical protein